MDQKRKKVKQKPKRKPAGSYQRQHSKQGIYSCIFAGSSAAVLLISILISFFMEGKGAGIVGGIGMIAVILALTGIQAAFNGLRERDKNHITCKAGLGAGIFILIILVIIFIGGLR